MCSVTLHKHQANKTTRRIDSKEPKSLDNIKKMFERIKEKKSIQMEEKEKISIHEEDSEKKLRNNRANNKANDNKAKLTNGKSSLISTYFVLDVSI